MRNREVSSSSVESSDVQICPRVHVDVDRRVVVACDCFSRQRWWTTNHGRAAREPALELSGNEIDDTLTSFTSTKLEIVGLPDGLQCVLLVPAL